MSQDQRDVTGGYDGVDVKARGAGSNHPDSAAIAEEAAAIYPATIAGGPTPEEIADEAYRIYLGRGGEHGRDFEDWLEAERRLARGQAPSEP